MSTISKANLKPLPLDKLELLKKEWLDYRKQLSCKKGSKKYRDAHFDFIQGVGRTLDVLGYQQSASIYLSLSSHRDFADMTPL